MNGITRLYTPELLGLAVGLANYPFDEGMPLTGQARSASCGSTLKMGLALDTDNRIIRIGMQVQACAIGQAAAAVFANHAIGQEMATIDETLAALDCWLSGKGSIPNWPGIQTIEPAHAFPGRHGAIRLPWQAASQALSKAPSPR